MGKGDGQLLYSVRNFVEPTVVVIRMGMVPLSRLFPLRPNSLFVYVYMCKWII